MSAPDLKRAAAERAIPLVEDGMRLGIGTGSTAAAFIKLLGERVRAGLNVTGVPTSEATRIACEREGIPLATLEDLPELDLTIDGADEVDGSLRLIKGGGAALLREKIVAVASRRMVVIADASKHVETLGAFPLPVEVNLFGIGATTRAVEAAVARAGCTGEIVRRYDASGAPLLTDGGHAILDLRLGRIPDPEALSAGLWAVPGVVEHGLFLGIADAAILAAADGDAAVVSVLGRL
ncbi:UNVERIFIED_ORG: ribose 5-phosphate isomerase A [Methylobacterium sp. SuP10 SLI 274]|uniref:ribose-5-phosphate isomerase RpiA n=1 Tax=Methylorubrum extorquens TaxID=408 RepID=UPI0020A0C28B|nr:ribose-5-phosphate isomerase RpiA [Methylorubrum extorquens]MDF9865439.1 ribose 5-phosphate isomerase A [Methylorubrum pseudosasae]MDH6639008.1 ribose 5-phosphate isomerase A [Methylobacterium sp. SuP10 SLI 274]MDH6668197.1 ribose 5-phosphate isomerase A [Methylorubrum zatmanii]MCP1560085.1 ribose 5-phosphate isomerase A [Methylorubrum extorquens]MDF9793739.1 ribose 5-phosphate isomerase A [Methylorubrum extorquens]